MLTKIFSKRILKLSVVILVNENLLRATPALSTEIKHRSFARWSARKPTKVFIPEQVASQNFETEEFYKSEYSESSETKKSTNKKPNEQLFQKECITNESSNFSDVFRYKVLDEQDQTFSKLMMQAGNRKMRKKNNLMILEGKRLNMDAIKAGLKPKKLFFTQLPLLKDLNLSPHSHDCLFKVSYNTIALWSKLETPPGIVGFYSMISEGDIKTKSTIPVKVVCDNVRDPGNMGSIIRVAASVGCTELVLLKGCTDPWDRKVLRSASGGHFHIPIKMDLEWSEHKEFLSPSDVVFLSDSHVDRKNCFGHKVPQHLYYDVNYLTQSLAIVIGGETEGLSESAFKLVSKYNGSRLYIPLSNCMESLNSGCALSVVLFEIKRQFLMTENLEEVSSTEKSSPMDDGSRSLRTVG